MAPETSTPTPRRRPLLLQAVAHVGDADSDWLITLRCGHRILRPKGEGRPTVFSRRDCPTASSRSSSAASKPPAVEQLVKSSLAMVGSILA